MESFRWDSHFETGLDLVDGQHHGLVDMVNALGALLGREEAHRTIGLAALVDDLLAYAGRHFADEEALMAEGGIDGTFLESHRRLHAEFARVVEDIAGAVRAGAPGVAENLQEFLVFWLGRHILGIDQSMARQLRAIAGGASPAEAWAAEQAGHDAAVEPMLRALNRLFRAVADRNRALEEANRLLEVRIAERTRHLAEANERLERMARTDALTGLANRRRALERLDEAWADGGELSVILMDADGFKAVNDIHGHEAGDRVLVEVARALAHGVRSDDLACRLGGDEFLVICPATPAEGAAILAEKLRATVAELSVHLGAGTWRGSLSVGVAVRDPVSAGPDDLLRRADGCLYLAKRTGRNRVCREDEPAARAA